MGVYSEEYQRTSKILNIVANECIARIWWKIIYRRWFDGVIQSISESYENLEWLTLSNKY